MWMVSGLWQNRQLEGAPADGQAVVAGGDGVPLAPLPDKHAMVGKGGLGRFEHTPDAGVRKIIAGSFGIVAQREVRNGELHFLGQFQQQPPGDAVLGADVRMDKGIGLDPVDVPQKQPQHLFGEGAILPNDKGLQQPVEIAQVDREAGDRRHMAVEDLQRVHGFEQVLRRFKL